ncbi:acyl-CoA dehydrogenase family protein [Actinomadura madurae]|nr:acyl-CoA dehydrogenase family protein [Actinomadura madurae]MCP9965063.1 acyl-CoA dehydrogenase family protein [Actinomadura madurae]
MSADVLASAELSAEFARWLAAHRTQATELSEAALRPAPAREYLDAQKTLQSWLYDEGWLARGWPKEYGGTGNDIGSRAAVYDLLGAADIAVPSTVNVVEILAPTLQRFAPGLAARMLPPLVAAPRRGARVLRAGGGQRPRITADARYPYGAGVVPVGPEDLVDARTRCRPVCGAGADRLAGIAAPWPVTVLGRHGLARGGVPADRRHVLHPALRRDLLR